MLCLHWKVRGLAASSELAVSGVEKPTREIDKNSRERTRRMEGKVGDLEVSKSKWSAIQNTPENQGR